MSAARRARQLLLAAVLLAACGAAAPVVNELKGHRVDSVRIAGEFKHVDRAVLERTIAGEITRGFFEVDVQAVRAAALELEWVRDASVRRVWPDALHVAIVEREPVARWNGTALLERDGSLFRPTVLPEDPALTDLAGPDDAEREVLAALARFRAALGDLGGGVERLEMVARGGWRVGLGNGVELRLAQGQDASTLRRFADVAPGVFAGGMSGIASVDLRYTNGFAVLEKETRVEGAEESKQ
ncbi:MAG: FtsQ-type POTRA domain-containing protein [Gammaproteobacteria bacterium]|nr:FtsQ-type POTRA domain-containing protein [Gammaproteobacteria bacterium]